MCLCSISRISPSWTRAGCKKTLCLLHYPRKIKFIHSFSLFFCLSFFLLLLLLLLLGGGDGDGVVVAMVVLGGGGYGKVVPMVMHSCR